MLLLILATSPWGFSELWGGVVPTLDIGHSGPILHRLLLRTLVETIPPSPPAIWCPVSPAVLFCPISAQYHPSTRASPVSVPSYQGSPATLPSLTCHYQRPTLPLLHRPHHACQIPVAADPMMLPKYLIEWSSSAAPQPSDATTDHVTFPLPLIMSPLHIPVLFNNNNTIINIFYRNKFKVATWQIWYPIISKVMNTCLITNDISG